MEEEIIEITWMVQLQHESGEWSYYSTHEHQTQEAAATLASQIYGGQLTTRLVKVVRSITK